MKFLGSAQILFLTSRNSLDKHSKHKMVENTGTDRQPSSTASLASLDRSSYQYSNNKNNTNKSSTSFTGGCTVRELLCQVVAIAKEKEIQQKRPNSTTFHGQHMVPELVLALEVTNTQRDCINTLTKLGVNEWYDEMTTTREEEIRVNTPRKLYEKKKNLETAGGPGNNNNPDANNDKMNPCEN